MLTGTARIVDQDDVVRFTATGTHTQGQVATFEAERDLATFDDALDLDGDGDVDLVDIDLLQSCALGDDPALDRLCGEGRSDVFFNAFDGQSNEILIDEILSDLNEGTLKI